MRCLVFAAVSSCLVLADGAQQQAMANPIRKVVTLLQKMQRKVEQEGKEELELYNKFMCYCKTGGGDLTVSIEAAKDKVPAVSSNIEESEAKLAGAKSDLKQAQSDRTAANNAMDQATTLREKEAKEFADLHAEYTTNIAGVVKATTALENGVASSFLQTPAAQTLQRVVSKSDLSESDQEVVASFLSQSNDYAPQSGDIIGILKQMGDTMAETLSDETKSEKSSKESYEGLIEAKKKEVAALTATVESKTKQRGELGVAIVNMKEDLEDTEATLKEDEAFFAGLKKSCATKTAEWEERSKTRAEELVALADTIKVLNDDDSLELFKKTLPSAAMSLLQVDESEASMRREALAVVRSAHKVASPADKTGLQFLVLALSGRASSKTGQAGFNKVITMIDTMVALLGKEQTDDDSKKEYCAAEFDESEDEAKSLKRHISNDESEIATGKELISTLTDEVAALEKGIRALDSSVAEATQQRKEENSEYKALMASDGAAKEVLGFAKNRLNKMYNPKLYKPAPKVELSGEDRIYSSMGGELSTTPAGGIAGTGIDMPALVQVSSHAKHESGAAPPMPPDTWAAYTKKSEEKNGVVAMIDLLISDLEKDMTQAEVDEKNSQEDYEQMMKDSAVKRTTDSKALSQKSSTRADAEASLQDTVAHKKKTTKELVATVKYIGSLHAECDWLLQYFEARKEARAGEVDSLKKAKAVLSGADNSFIQVRSHSFLSRAR